MKLYEITGAMKRVEEMLLNGEITEEATADTLDALKHELQTKGSGIVSVLRNFDATAEAIKVEIDRLKALKERHEKASERLKEYVKTCMVYADIDKIDCGIGKLSLRDSEATIIDDPEKIPAKFLTIIPESYKPNLTAIKAAIKSGEDVPGAHIEERVNLQVR